MFDEPSSYLDVKQRLNAARAIRNLMRPDDYVIVVEHDLAVRLIIVNRITGFRIVI